LFDQKVKEIYQYIVKYSNSYLTPHVLIMWGDDFSHVVAKNTFGFMDSIIAKIRARPKKVS